MNLIPANAVQDFIQMGGRLFTGVDNLKILQLYTGANASQIYGSFREGAGTSGYQVPVGKKLVIMATRIQPALTSAAAGSELFRLTYSDNDTGLASNTSPTNVVYYGGGGNVYQGFIHSNPVCLENSVYFEVPAGKYPGIIGSSAVGGTVTIIAKEVDA